MPVLASASGRVAVATAPRGYLKFGWPTTTPVRALREVGMDTIDVPTVVREMEQRMLALLDRSHGKRIQDYDT